MRFMRADVGMLRRDLSPDANRTVLALIFGLDGLAHAKTVR